MKKLIVSSDSLHTAMKKLGHAVNSKSVLPVLNYILCRVDDKKVELITSDLELTILITLDAETKGHPFSFFLPFDYMSKLVALLGSQPLSFEVVNDKMVRMTADSDDFELKSAAAIDDFPKIPSVPKKNAVSLNDNFIGLLKKAMATVSKDDSRPVLTGACLDIAKKGSTLVSTDAHTMFTHKLPIKHDEPEKLIITAKLAKAMEGIKEFDLSWTQDLIGIKTEGVIICCKRIEGKYPDYRVVIPEYEANLKVNLHLLTDAMNKACLSTNQYKHTKMLLTKEPGVIHFEYDDEEKGRKAHLKVKGDYTGKTEIVGINAGKFLTVLGQIDKDEINLHIDQPEKAVVITADDEPDYKGLLIPLKLNA